MDSDGHCLYRRNMFYYVCVFMSELNSEFRVCPDHVHV